MKVVIYAQQEPSGMPLDGLAGALRGHGVEPLVPAAPSGEGSRSAIGTLAACLSEAERALRDAGDAALLIGAGDWPLTGAIAGLKAKVPVLRLAGARPEGVEERTAALLALLAPIAIEGQDPEAAASEVAGRLRGHS